MPLAFVALGLAWWGVPLREPPAVGSVRAAHPTYPELPMERTSSTSEAEHWLVDGFNVVQVGLLRDRSRDDWWSEARRAELMERAATFARRDARTWVVFDGPREGTQAASERLHAVFAASADEWLVARVKQAADPTRVVVVTADRRLANRVRHHGARVVAPADFLRQCEPGTVPPQSLEV